MDETTRSVEAPHASLAIRTSLTKGEFTRYNTGSVSKESQVVLAGRGGGFNMDDKSTTQMEDGHELITHWLVDGRGVGQEDKQLLPLEVHAHSVGSGMDGRNSVPKPN